MGPRAFSVGNYLQRRIAPSALLPRIDRYPARFALPLKLQQVFVELIKRPSPALSHAYPGLNESFQLFRCHVTMRLPTDGHSRLVFTFRSKRHRGEHRFRPSGRPWGAWKCRLFRRRIAECKRLGRGDLLPGTSHAPTSSHRRHCPSSKTSSRRF